MSNTIETKHLQDVLNNHGQDMSNKVVAITGTTSGTGFYCARELAKLGATVILLNRNSERAQSALDKLQAAVPRATFDAVTCDLQNLASVNEAIQTIKARYAVLDVLINNAGVMALKDQATADGYDVQMQTNVIAHFLLTKELFPLLKKSSEGRIVNHSSMARLGGPLKPEYFGKNGGNLGGDEADSEEEGARGPRWERYHQTKLANAVFTYALAKKLKAAGISNVIPLLAHPGLSRTQLQVTTAADGGMDADSDFMKQAQSAEDGATGIIRAAVDPEAKAGNFYGPESWTGYPDLINPEALLLDEANATVFWEGCEKAVGAFMF
jgi:NAD(P)-dependent dehydrogenase (short-subunit alcohol dehydrogenase family)